MFNREYGLVPNRATSDRFMAVVRWERVHRVTQVDAMRGHVWVGEFYIPVRREYQALNGRWACVRITEIPLTKTGWPVAWPKGEVHEPESLRRERIRTIRAAMHVDLEKAAAEPEWRDEPRAAV